MVLRLLLSFSAATGLILFLCSLAPLQTDNVSEKQLPKDTIQAAAVITLPDSAQLDSLVLMVTEAMRKHENSPGRKVELVGYIPCSKKNYKGNTPYSEAVYGWVKGWSGVTIATGADLGTRYEQDIDQLPLRDAKGADDTATKRILKRFTFRSGQDAVAALRAYYLENKKSLTISERTALQIERGTHQYELTRMIRSYEEQRLLYGNDRPFVRLPAEIQLGIYSYVYQTGMSGDFPGAVWNSFCAADYEQVIAYLNMYPPGWERARREHEIALIRAGLQKDAVRVAEK